jgi:hypothetical protein
MRIMLLAAGLAAIAAPVDAEHWSGSQRLSESGHHRDSHHSGRHHNRHSDGRFDGPVGWYGGDWAYYNNRSFSSDSYNDWWHDRPDRAFPRWMQSNQNCARLWWSGGGWRC